MRTMEIDLKNLDPQLYATYEKSLKKATEEWLPNVIPKLDSYNSLPHILGVTKNVNMLLYNEEFGHAEIELNALELYILLNSILFHDIGKCNSTGDKKTSHAAKSYNMIRKSWAVLGIESQRMAAIIARIAIFHDYSESQYSQKNIIVMREDNASVYSYGFVREKLLSALLFLADRLDSSYTRVVPDYINDKKGIVGDFRNHIASTYFDKYSKMACTVINKNSFSASDFDGELDIHGILRDYLQTCSNGSEHAAVEVYEKSRAYVLANDLYKNSKDIKLIRNELHIMHIPIAQWYIECNSHLFKVEKNESTKQLFTKLAIEPILDEDYCYDVFRAMFMLNIGIFEAGYQYYNSIVNCIHEDIKDTDKVKCAVRRLSLLNKFIEKEVDFDIYCDENVWSIQYKPMSNDNKTIYKDLADSQFDAVYIDKYIDKRWEKILNLIKD